MSSKRHRRRQRQYWACERKVRHETREDAELVFRRMRRFDEDLTIYGCHFCGGWHIGHNPGVVRRIIEMKKEQ
jgi:hypothetical protein